MMTTKITSNQLKQRQALSLDLKEMLSANRIRQWYEHWAGMVYVSFSGGKDSTVLLDLVRKQYPEIPAVFVNTGQEYAEIIRFVKSVDNVIWLKPKFTFWQVVEKYGWPVVSKETSQKIYEARTTKSAKLLHKRLHGDNNKYKSGKIPNKWQYLIDAPFKISHRCCHWLKIEPIHRFEKQSGLRSFVGLMAVNSQARKQKYLKQGCNAYDNKKKTSIPLAFWKESDIWDYVTTEKLPYSEIYNQGEKNTGCKYCMYGCHLDKINKFQRMRKRTPGQFENLRRHGGCEVLDALKVNYEEPKLLF